MISVPRALNSVGVKVVLTGWAQLFPEKMAAWLFRKNKKTQWRVMMLFTLLVFFPQSRSASPAEKPSKGIPTQKMKTLRRKRGQRTVQQSIISLTDLVKFVVGTIVITSK